VVALVESSILSERKFCFIDFEFCESNQRQLNLTSCSYQLCTSEVVNVWLKGSDKRKRQLSKYLKELNRQGYIFVAYAATAEARSFLAMGLDPNEFKWVDLYFEHRQLTHTYNKFKYGRYYKKTGIMRTSVPPSYDARKNIGKDNNEVGMGYKDAVAVHFGAHIDSSHKTAMRDLILENKPEYSKQEKHDIMNYCASDIKWLPKLLVSMNKEIAFVTRCTKSEILEIQIRRGDFAASLAKMEEEGFPLDVDAVNNLRDNYEIAKDEIIEELNNVYPFYVREKSRKSEFKGTYKKKYDRFKEFVETCEQIDHNRWALSEKSGKYKSDEKTLDNYLGIPEIKAYKDANKLMGQMKWFQLPESEEDTDFFDNVGSDGRLRAFLGAFGTQTGRNAPKAKTFVLAMSSWLRCLVRPEKGESIVAIDYASQEFIIAAIMSRDPDMMKAYASGDPYLYFAKKAGAVPENGTKAQYPNERNLFKATTLGLQYGMGALSLSIKLTADCGRIITEAEAKKLISLHKKTYPRYWVWLDNQEYEYKRNKYLMLKDGWALLPDNDNGLSVKNFPVQGTGAVIMRRAVYLAHRKGLRLLAPLHDAIYAIYNEVTEADHPRLLSECMQQAVVDVLGDVEIRQDIDIHDHDHTWVEEKGKKYYDLLNKYLDEMETPADTNNRLMETMFSDINKHVGYNGKKVTIL